DPLSGGLATAGCPRIATIPFLNGTAPTQICPLHGGLAPSPALVAGPGTAAPYGATAPGAAPTPATNGLLRFLSSLLTAEQPRLSCRASLHGRDAAATERSWSRLHLFSEPFLIPPPQFWGRVRVGVERGNAECLFSKALPRPGLLAGHYVAGHYAREKGSNNSAALKMRSVLLKDLIGFARSASPHNSRLEGGSARCSPSTLREPLST